MREILFRGKRIDNGEWVEGFFSNETCDSVFSPMYEQANIIKKGTGYWYSVIPNTVGQYTGLTDKNGKRIFEGDIVYDKYSNKAYISMEKGCWVLMYKEDWDFLETNASTCGVIGNIHDNSELLRGGKHDTNT